MKLFTLIPLLGAAIVAAYEVVAIFGGLPTITDQLKPYWHKPLNVAVACGFLFWLPFHFFLPLFQVPIPLLMAAIGYFGAKAKLKK